MLLIVTGCQGKGVTRDLTATKAAYGMSVNALRAVPGVSVSIDSGLAGLRPCALNVHTSDVRYRVGIGGTTESYTATFQADRPT